MSLSYLIKEARKKSGKTLQQLGDEIGYHGSYLSLAERGLRRLDDEGVVRIALALGLDPEKALIAGLRERLPEGLRKHLPDELAPTVGGESRHAVLRQLHAEELDFEVGRFRVDVTSDWDGNLRMVRRLTDCRPNSARRPVLEVSFKERVLGSKAGDSDEPMLEVNQAPSDLDLKVVNASKGDTQFHRLVFPKGWRRATQKKDDSLSFTIRSNQEQGLYLKTSDFIADAGMAGIESPVKGALNFFVRHFINRLEVSLELPSGYDPELWAAWTWWGTGNLEATTRNLGEKPCRTLKFRSEANKAELVVLEPLAGYTFSIIWTPLDPQRYLEARYGDLNGKK